MSLNAMVNDTMTRRVGPPAQALTPEGVAGAQAQALMLEGVTGAQADVVARAAAAAGSAAAGEATNKVFQALTQYIPTEILAPYAAALSLAEVQNTEGARQVYIWFTIAAPFVLVFFYYVKLALDKKPWPSWSKGATDGWFLVWRAILAGIAFAVWGTAVPTNPVQASIGGPAVAGFLATIVSPVLFGCDAIFTRVMGRD